MKSNGNKQYYQQDRIYDSDHLALALPADLPGGSYRYLVEVKDKSKQKIIVEDFYSSRDVRTYKDFSPTIRSERLGLKVVQNS